MNYPHIIYNEPFHDHRGYFLESFKAEEWKRKGIEFVTDNHAMSHKDVFRGLHYQTLFPQGKLITMMSGSVFDFCVDVRDTPTGFGEIHTFFLSAGNFQQLWIPPGFAHGYLATEDNTIMTYKATQYRHTASEVVIRWDDPRLEINLPRMACMSGRDKNGIYLKHAPRIRIGL